MKTITLSGPPEALDKFLTSQQSKLEAAGITVDREPAQVDDPDMPPADVLEARGLSPEEWRRARSAPPAAEPGAGTAAAPPSS